MSFDELIRNRYSVRSYVPKEVPQNIVDEIIEAARVAPSAGNAQPTVVYVLGKDKFPLLREYVRYDFGAQNMLLVGYDKNLSLKRNIDNYDFGIEDTAIAITHMMLKITDLGLGSCWVGYINKQMKDVFNIEDNIELVALLPFGYITPGDVPNGKHNQRRSMEEFKRIIN